MAAPGRLVELRDAAEAVIAFVPLHTGEPLTGWQRNGKERRQVAIARLRALIDEVVEPLEDDANRGGQLAYAVTEGKFTEAVYLAQEFYRKARDR